MVTSAKRTFACQILILFMVFLTSGNVMSSGAVSKEVSEQLPERCRMEPPARGECKALFSVYFFNQGTNNCEESFYGGCGGIVPFDTDEECRQLCESAERLKMISLKPYEGFPYLLVEIEYPSKWGDPNFIVTVDGKVAGSRPLSGGFSGGVSTKTLAVSAGETGLKAVEVSTVIDGSVQRVWTKRFLDYPDMVVLLDHTGDNEALFEKSPLRFFLFQVTDPSLSLNGNPVAVKKDTGSKSGIVTVTPAWKPGRNTVIIETTGRGGKAIKKEFSFMYLPGVTPSPRPSIQSFPAVSPGYQFFTGGRFYTGDRMTIPYGEAGGKSGPFFTLNSTDGSLGIAEIDRQISERYSIDAAGWLINSTAILWEVTGRHPGKAVLQFMVKRHFLGVEELEKELEITVAPRQK